MINKGKIDFENSTFIKHVVFSKAVLWKDRQLSIPREMMDKIIRLNISKMEFYDETKNEVWEFPVEKVRATMILKKVGQEPQYYFPIGLAKKRNIKDQPQPEEEKNLESKQTLLF